jgi:superfamily I DNA/RNA helicase
MAIYKRWVGGAGTGKTSLILDCLTEAKASLGLSTDEIGLCTFTRAGRQELSERAAEAWGVDVEALTKSGWFRTAHSIAYRQSKVEQGQLLEGEDGIEWTSQKLGERAAPGSGDPASSGWETRGETDASIALRAWELARQSLVPLSQVISDWTQIGDTTIQANAARVIIDKYEHAKRAEGRLDFTDVASRFAGVRHTVDGPVEVEPTGDVPEQLRVLAIDEAQDSSAIVDRICRRIARSPNIERVFLLGDPYQSILGFNGADYRHFLSWDADESIMPRSYRCPKVIMDYGERCLRQMRSGYRDRKISPAPHEGSILHARHAHEAVSRIDPSRSTLVIARVAFALAEYEDELKARKIPYSWIDRVGSASSLSGYKCLWDLEHGQIVSGDDWAAAIAMSAASHPEAGKLIVHGEKKAWKDGRRGNIDFIRPIPEDMELAGCTPKMVEFILSGRWPEAMDSRHRDKAAAWRSAALTHGTDVASNPRVRLSTIHSAKGMEGDLVILSTVSSKAVETSRVSLAARHDEECRVNYVAVTRARENLLVVDDGSRYSLELPA